MIEAGGWGNWYQNWQTAPGSAPASKKLTTSFNKYSLFVASAVLDPDP